jgi:YVTN family beta-propeller protein
MKNLKKFSILLFTALLVGNFFISCDNVDEPKNEPITEDTIKGEYSNGVFITNEGSFGNSNGSLSFYKYDNDSVYNAIFELVNSRPLGDVVQSATVSGDMVYIVVNNSNKVEVANRNTMLEAGVIEGLISPRYMVAKSNKGFISCWGDNSVKVVDLTTLAVTKTVGTNGSGPEKMLISNNKLYVINSGGWGMDSTIAVINTTTDELIKNIQVPYNPRDLVIDKQGYIWVLCYGKEIYNSDFTAIIEQTPSKIYKIDPSTDEIMASGDLFAEQHPSSLEIDNDGSTLYVGGGFSFGGVYKATISESDITLNQIITDYAYGFNFDPATGVLFVAIAGNYTSAGVMKRYKNDGTLLGTYTCGIGTSGAAFKSTKK